MKQTEKSLFIKGLPVAEYQREYREKNKEVIAEKNRAIRLKEKIAWKLLSEKEKAHLIELKRQELMNQ